MDFNHSPKVLALRRQLEAFMQRYLLLAWLLSSGRMTPARSRRIHLAIFAQLVAIALLAKSMFYL